jgi:probable H4MPT-linked C1 transfer pathway protein
MTWLGIDVGGANLKAADGRGWARSAPFALWREPAGLGHAIRDLTSSAPAIDQLAVTMTGELCDSFRTKAEGVRHILSAVEAGGGGREVRVYLVDGRLVRPDEARDVPQLAAASNWHALARYACRYLESGAGVLVDVGSTTTDIVPLSASGPCPTGFTDTERLLTGELVYSGVARTPVCAVVDAVPWRGQQCPVAAELFATTGDAYVLLGELAPDSGATWTADGRPLTRPFARERLARMICADRTMFDVDDAIAAAQTIRGAQLQKLRAALCRIVSAHAGAIECVVVSGSGEFLARALVREALSAVRVVSMSERFGPAASACAPAHALAILAAETPLP